MFASEKPESRLQHVGHRADAVVDVVVPEHGQADEDQDQPAIRAGRRGTSGRGLSFGHVCLGPASYTGSAPRPIDCGYNAQDAGAAGRTRHAQEPYPMTTAGFDNERYLAEQTAAITKRVEACGDKLYLEFGGKLMFDFHAARVLPGFDPNVKLRLLQKLGDDVEVLLCIYAGDIERRKVRADFGITYDSDALKLIDDLRRWNIQVSAVVITRYDEQPAARVFKNKLERQGVRVYTHGFTTGYPTDVDTIVSARGYGANTFIPTTKRLVVVTAPGPGSGKLATCLSQLYHEHMAGRTVGYAKFETFPIWNLPLKHPVNIAYESATADLRDFNLVDPFHLEAYGQTAVNYNRDVEIFPVLRRILERILGKAPYKSPTDMGVNRAGFGIVDDEAVRDAAKQEAIRRYYRSACEYLMGFVNTDTVQRTELLMEEMGVGARDRAGRPAGRRRREAGEGDRQGQRRRLLRGGHRTGRRHASSRARTRR